MFGRSQRAVFKPSVYQPGQRTRRMPRWLVLLLVGIALGAGGVLFPADLEKLENPDLLKFLAEWDQTKGTGVGSGAENWADLRDRMNYICSLFRSRQQDPNLFEAPFARMGR